MLAPDAVPLAIEYLAIEELGRVRAKERADDDLSHVGSWPVTRPGGDGSTVAAR
jgi:hypothetical protein